MRVIPLLVTLVLAGRSALAPVDVESRHTLHLQTGFALSGGQIIHDGAVGGPHGRREAIGVFSRIMQRHTILTGSSPVGRQLLASGDHL